MQDTNYTRIAAQELQQWRDEGRPMLLLDVLPPEVHAARRLPGACSACVFQVDFPDLAAAAGAAPGADVPVVVYGEDGQTRDAAAAAAKLVRLGCARVYVLAGGIADWLRLGLPVEGHGALPADHDALPPDGSWTVVPAESLVAWTGRSATARHTGTLAVDQGTIRVVDGKVGGGFGMPLDSLADDDLADPGLRALLVRHLLSDDFLFAGRHPRAEFTVVQSEFLDGAAPGTTNYHVRGELLLRGRIEPLALPLILAPVEGGVSLKAHFDLDRTRWGLDYGSGKLFRRLGKHLIHDMVSLDVALIAR
jgi:rhodanese-related sulfurtransferase